MQNVLPGSLIIVHLLYICGKNRKPHHHYYHHVLNWDIRVSIDPKHSRLYLFEFKYTIIN